MFSGQAFTN